MKTFNMKNNGLANNQKTWQAFKNFLGQSTTDAKIFINSWVEISENDIVKEFANKSNFSTTLLRQTFIDYIAQKINESRYGAGCIYELYESRRQGSIQSTLALLSNRLNESELAYFKQEVGYEENFKDESGYCSKCDGSITADELGFSLQNTGKELCSFCCHLEMI